MQFLRQASLALIIAAATLFGPSLGAVTSFETDVSTAIDRGIEWLANNGAFNNPSSAGDASGLPMLALLEKRASGNPLDPPQGYNGANATDQGRLRTAAAYILDRANETSFYAYRDGNWLFALSEYARTGGPDKSVLAPANADYETIKQVMDRLVDRTIAAQQKASNGYPQPIDQGYWCYTGPGCKDSSTTQFAVAGLAAAKAFYSSSGSGDGGVWADPARLVAVDAALALSRQAYELNAHTGSDNASCNVMTPTERGHGYNANFGSVGGYAPSLAQTASGVYIQLFGGSNVNSPALQRYIEWLRNRYRWQDLDNLGNSWPGSSWSYYMWSSFKGMELIRQSGIVPNPGNLGPNDLGALPAANAPACNVRQDNKVPAAVSRPASFGAGGAGYYAAESKSQYFDYAHQILSLQCYDGSLPISGSDGFFGCNASPGYWDQWSHQSYLLLVLQRATGGGCVDTDGDGVCDSDDNCPAVANPNQENTFGGPAGDACEAPPAIKLTVAAAPGSGTAGVSNINVTGALWPAGVYGAADVTISVAPSCFGVADRVEVTASNLVTVLGATKRATFRLPANAKNGPNFVWLSGPGFATVNCSTLTVVGGLP